MSETSPFIRWKRGFLYPPFWALPHELLFMRLLFSVRRFHSKFFNMVFYPRGHSLIKVTGGPTLRLLPGAVQQLKLLPRVDTTSKILQPREEKLKHCYLELTEM